MLTIQALTASEADRWYSAIQTDFDRRELFSRRAVRRAIRHGEAEFLLFCDSESGIPQGYALCVVKNLYGYVLLKYFGILPWYREHGLGIEAMRLLNKRYADRQGILAELNVFEDSEEGEYLRKLRKFFSRFGYEEVACPLRIGGAETVLTAKPMSGTSEIAPVAPRILSDFYRRVLRPAELENMLSFEA